MKRLLLGIAFTLYSTFVCAFSYTLELSEDKIQKKAESMMPLKKKKFFITTTLTEPVIDLIASTNEINLTSNVNVKAPGNISGNGKVSFTGSLRYESDSGSFYFDNLKVNSLDIDAIPQKVIPKIKGVLELLAKRVLATKPVYKFKDDNLKHKLAKAALKSIKVTNETLFVELGVF
jgi:hypothetical protein